MMPERRVFTVTEIANILMVSERTVYKMAHDGTLPVIWVRGQIRVTAEALDDFLKGDCDG